MIVQFRCVNYRFTVTVRIGRFSNVSKVSRSRLWLRLRLLLGLGLALIRSSGRAGVTLNNLRTETGQLAATA